MNRLSDIFFSRWTPVFWGLLAFAIGCLPHLFFESTCDSLLHMQAFQAIGSGTFRIPYAGSFLHVYSAHLWPIGAALAPVFALFPSYLLLIACQSAALASSLPAMSRLLSLRNIPDRNRKILMLAWMFHPLLWAIHLENRESYQLPTFAIPLILWGQWAWETKRHRTFLALGAALLLLREDVALTVAFWCLFLLIKDHRRPATYALLVAATAWFVCALQVVIPHFSTGVYSLSGWGYEWAGSNPSQVLRHIVTHPLASLAHMASTTRIAAIGLWLVATLGSVVLSPLWLLPALPQLGINFLSDTASIHLPLFRYSAPILPFLWLATLDTIARKPAWLLGARFLPLGAPLVVVALFSRWVPDVHRSTLATLRCLERDLPHGASLSMTSFRGVSRLWSPDRTISLLDGETARNLSIPLQPWVLIDHARRPTLVMAEADIAPLEIRLQHSPKHRLLWTREGISLWAPIPAAPLCMPLKNQ